MAVFLRRSDEVGDIDSSIHWYAVTGTKVDLDHNLRLRDLEARLEEEFDGVMPVEIMIDTKRKKGVLKLATLKRMNELEEFINEIPELSKPVSVVSLVKYAKQAYYNGNPEYYDLPSSQENTFILHYVKNSGATDANLLSNFVDSTGQYARITTFMKDIGTDKMKAIEKNIQTKIDKLFPEERYTVIMTGKALVFQKGTTYLVKNLALSLV